MTLGDIGAGRHRSRYYFELNRNAQHLLRQVVMNLSRDTCSFGKYSIELGSDAPHAKPVKLPNHSCQQNDQQRIEPVGLIEARLEIELKSRALLAPNAVIVCSHHPKAVVARLQVCIKGGATCSAIDPIGIKALELIFESDFIGRHKAQCRVVKVQTSNARRQANPVAQ